MFKRIKIIKVISEHGKNCMVSNWMGGKWVKRRVPPEKEYKRVMAIIEMHGVRQTKHLDIKI